LYVALLAAALNPKAFQAQWPWRLAKPLSSIEYLKVSNFPECNQSGQVMKRQILIKMTLQKARETTGYQRLLLQVDPSSALVASTTHPHSPPIPPHPEMDITRKQVGIFYGSFKKDANGLLIAVHVER
jgi:hypothetical protein